MEQKSKLEIITKALETNPNVFIVRKRDFKDVPETESYSCFSSYYAQVVDLVLRPRADLCSEISKVADEMQSFMLSLVPNLEAAYAHNFIQNDTYLSIGRIYFTERIGHETRIQTLTDEELPNLINQEHDNSGTTLQTLMNEGFINQQEIINRAPRFVNGKRIIDGELKRLVLLRPYPNHGLAKRFLYDVFCPNAYLPRSVELEELKKSRPRLLERWFGIGKAGMSDERSSATL